MSAASSSCQGSFDVFLNFRGEDTRNGFTAYLYEALCSKGIQTFMDADRIVKGDEISPALVTAIHNSMFYVVVLSKNYASSTWCLDELVQILKCKNAKKQTVLPIFYHVNPSDVRQQKGSFAEALAKHEKKFKEKVKIWKRALTEVGNLNGWDARNRHEPTLIKEIIEHISSRLIDVKAMIGVDSHLPASKSDMNEYEKSLLVAAPLLASASESAKRAHSVSDRHTNEYEKSLLATAHLLSNASESGKRTHENRRHTNEYGKSLSTTAHILSNASESGKRTHENRRHTNEYGKSTAHLLANASEFGKRTHENRHHTNEHGKSTSHLLANASRVRNIGRVQSAECLYGQEE